MTWVRASRAYRVPEGRVVGCCYRCRTPVRSSERTMIYEGGRWRFVVHRACRIYAERPGPRGGEA